MASSSSSLLIVDTDVGFDDLLAIYGLARLHSNILITTVGGVIHASKGATALRQLFPALTISIGKDAPNIIPDPLPNWLENYRSHTLDAFLDKMKETSPEENERKPPNECNSAWVEISRQLNRQPDNSATLLCIGPLTNLAHWLDNEVSSDLLSLKLNKIIILGGNHPSSRMSNVEFNFSLDPIAAHCVLSKSIFKEKLYLISTGGVCDYDALIQTLGQQRLDGFIKKSKISSENSNQSFFLPTLLQFDTGAFCLSCDPVSAFVASNPKRCQWEHLPVQVDSSTGLVFAATTNTDTKISIATRIDLEGYFDWICTLLPDG